MYVLVSYRLFILTGTLKDVVVPDKTGKEMVRNYVVFTVSVCALLSAGWFVVKAGGLHGTSFLADFAAHRDHFDP